MAFVRTRNRAALAKLLSHSDIKAVYENKSYQHQLAESLPLIQQPAAAATGRDGAGTTVAVLDTGVNYTLPAFGCIAPGVPATCRVVAAVDVAPDDYTLDDIKGHGTNVAAIIVGVAQGAKIAAVDVFTGQVAYSSDIINGINLVINNESVYNIVAMNLSLGASAQYTTECNHHGRQPRLQSLAQLEFCP